MTDDRKNFANNLQQTAEKQFGQYFFIGWHLDGKWLMTASHTLDKEHMTYLRDWLTRQIDDQAPNDK